MSHDGSSAKSYIRHATEKERLDNLAFASFPEDYLPYAAAPGHHRVAAPPPYLLWGDDRRRRQTTRRRKPRCAGALLCAIALVVVAILAVVAISVYLGVVTNLFRSPVASVSGRFLSPEEFTEALLNSSSPQFLEKADFFKSKVEKAFLSSSLEPAFIAARIYSFRPGLIVFFRVYLDRRKLLQDDGESAPIELVRELVAQKLTEDPESVHVEENEELLAVEHRASEKLPTLTSTTTKPVTDQQNPHPQPPRSGGVGEWRPVPIEDSVKPSFADRPQGGVGAVNSPEESIRRNPLDGFGSVRVPEENLKRNPSLSGNAREGVGSVRVPEENPQRNPPVSGNSREGFESVRVVEESPPKSSLPGNTAVGVGSVKVVEESPPKSSLSGSAAAGVGSVRVVEDIHPRNPILPGSSREGVGSVRVAEEQTLRNPQSVNRREGTGSVRLLDKLPTEIHGNPPGVGTVRVVEDTPTRVSNLPDSLEGVGSVRLLEETPKKNEQLATDSRVGVGSIRGLEETPSRKPPLFGRPSETSGSLRILEEPPTLAPFVSLIIRNRSRSDKPRNTTAKIERGGQNADLARTQHTGVASIREIITEVDSFPLPPLIPAVASRLLDLGSRDSTESNYPEETSTEVSTKSEILEGNQTESPQLYESTVTTLTIQEDGELLLLRKSEGSKLNNEDSDQIAQAVEVKLLPSSSIHTETPIATETTSESTLPADVRLSSLENILFSHRTINLVETTVNVNKDVNLATESISADYEFSTTSDTDFSESTTSLGLSTSSHIFEESVTEEVTTASTEISDTEDSHTIHTIIDDSIYPNPKPHYQTIASEHSASSSEPFEMHTREGHGFHKPSNNMSAAVLFVVPNSNASSTNAHLASQSNSSAEDSQQKPSEVIKVFSEQDSSHIVAGNVEFTEHSVTSTPQASDNTSVGEQIWTDEDEVTNATTEDNSQQPKVVPQLQSDLISNNIEDESGDEDERFEDEILRHITTLAPQQNGSNVVSSIRPSSCPPGSVPCDVEGCGVRCDMRKDCSDNEDERDCSCSDLLRAMGQSQKMCDGVDDCSDGSDEADCPWCPSTDHFRCPGSRTCINLDQVCDGREDCPTGHDERRCVTLADSSADADSFEYRRQGYLVVRRQGRWGKLCLDSLGHSPDQARRTKELGRAVCSALTYRNMSSSVRALDETESEDSYYQISATSVNNRSSSASSLFELSPCKGREVLRVQCHSLECGLRPSVSPTQRRRIVGGRSANGAGAWPWAAALYREGDFQCGAALINDRWLISAAHCFYSSQGAYWTARLGVLRRGSELPSNGEQVRRIQNIILHPQYEDIGFINDIALLKMHLPVPFSDALRPICLPSSLSEDASLWHGRRCSVVGWGKLYEIGHTFPDSLQEVQLPVISSAECQRRSLFLPAYRITPNMFCAGYERGGRDACLGDSGGPMACQRPADGRWLLLGVTSNGDGCGRPNRPGVYTQVASYLTWIRETTSKEKESDGRTGSESTCSGGVRCRLGRCISRTRVCDGRRDCAGGEDEDSC